MTGKEVAPQLGQDSFSCPHCGALAHQHWFRIFARSSQRDDKPFVYRSEDFTKAKFETLEREEKKQYAEFFKRFKKNEVTYEQHRHGENCTWELANAYLSMCHSCDAFAVWIKDGLVWPAKEYQVEPHEDMPPDVKEDFIEAASIIDQSPRGAAALVRLAIQKLMVDLGEKGKNLNDDIAALVEKGLESSIQKALDIVRVIGNNAVHPGEISIKDDKATAIALLNLVNLIVDRRIGAKRSIDEMFKNLPPGALEAIAKRDKAE
jgi:hypothetical protein